MIKISSWTNAVHSKTRVRVKRVRVTHINGAAINTGSTSKNHVNASVGATADSPKASPHITITAPNSRVVDMKGV